MSNLDRFINAQVEAYPRALSEVKSGRKQTHWMWYIFPQIAGLGQSSISEFYSISSLNEAREYLDNDVLGERLRNISLELLNLETNQPEEVFGDIDALKLNSCMTLFEKAAGDEKSVFSKVIDKFYAGERDKLTLEIIENSKILELKK